MLLSYIRSILVGIVAGIAIVVAVGALANLFPTLFLVGAVALIGWFSIKLLRESFAVHKHYVEHEKASDEAFRKTMNEYVRACRKDLWEEFKRIWRDRRGHRANP